jgi:phosphatidylglycerophosphatase A
LQCLVRLEEPGGVLKKVDCVLGLNAVSTFLASSSTAFFFFFFFFFFFDSNKPKPVQ